MLLDTKNIISMTDLRTKLTDIMMMAKQGRSYAVSDRGKIISLIVPVDEINSAKKEDLRNDPAFGMLKKAKISDQEFLSELSGSWW
jgi:antitoxin (DNA-binding transcriptional repressor) of toxin-antitoxin stability system